MFMFGIGPAELVTLLIVGLSLGGAGGLPLSTPPLPPDPVIARAAVDHGSSGAWRVARSPRGSTTGRSS
jgi:hypothetical protein